MIRIQIKNGKYSFKNFMITFAQRKPLVQFISLKIRMLIISITCYIQALQNFCEIASAIFAEQYSKVQNLYGTCSTQPSINLKTTFTKTLLQNELKKEAQVMHTIENGIQENGIQKKVTLKEAADLVMVPKKTLEDYIQIFNKAQLIINIEEISEKKMGFLRSFMKKNKSKIRKAMILQKQKKIEENLKKQNQEVDENNQQNKIEYEYESVTDTYPGFQNDLTGNCDQDNKSAFDDYDDWEYSNQFFNKICLNHHFD